MLENVRSAENVGAMFRTADAFGVAELWCVGYTPLPRDRFERANSKIAKTALGAERTLPWKHFVSSEEAIHNARTQGMKMYALEQTEMSLPLTSLRTEENVVVVVGNEVEGVSQEVKEKADAIYEIPMHGTKESLNVSVACGIALYALRYSRGE